MNQPTNYFTFSDLNSPFLLFADTCTTRQRLYVSDLPVADLTALFNTYTGQIFSPLPQ